MEGLVEIKQWLYVWTEAERARRLNKKPRDEAQGEVRENPDRDETEEVMRPVPCMSCAEPSPRKKDQV